MMPVSKYLDLRCQVIEAGYGDEVEWAQKISRPETAEEMALEAIFVIVNSGMKATVARPIYNRVVIALREGRAVTTAFKHPGKSEAIEQIWKRRHVLLAEFQGCKDDAAVIAFCLALPWVGEITQYHLAKNFGANVAKPDRHLERIAKHYGTTTRDLCEHLADGTGDRIATVDMVLWRAAERGLINTRNLETA